MKANAEIIISSVTSHRVTHYECTPEEIIMLSGEARKGLFQEIICQIEN